MNTSPEEYIDPGPRNVADVVLGSGTDGGRTALIEHASGRTHTYGDLRAAVEGFAAVVRRSTQPGDAVAIVCDNGAEFVAAYHGTLLAGRTVLPLEPLGPPSEWAMALTRRNVPLAVMAAAAWRRLRARPVPGVVRTVVVIGDEPPTDPVPDSVDVMVWNRWPDPTVVPAAAGGAHTAVLASSSGTQGMPKQVVLTHHNLVANLAQIAVLHRLTSTDVTLGVPPFRHIYGMQMVMNPTLAAGGTIITVTTPFSAVDFLTVIHRHRITVAYVVPSILAELAQHGDVVGYDTRSLRLVVSGGAPLPQPVADTSARLLGAPVVQGYGMSEAGCLYFSPDDSQVTPGSIGVAVPGTRTRFIDPETGHDVDDGAPGEIWVRGPQISPGYLDEKGDLTPLTDDAGWFRTGDIGRRDVHGCVTLTGRSKHLIKYKGHQVAPAELEAILVTHPAVADAAVVGVPDDLAGEVPKAFVVLRAAVDLGEVVAHVADRVAPYKRIRRIAVVDAIPRSSTGKVLGHALREGQDTGRQVSC